MFWERLKHNEQNRYWELSQRMKKYVAATLQYPDAVKRYMEWFNASFEEKEKILRREERKINHFYHNPEKHVVFVEHEHYQKIFDRMVDLSFDIIENKCTDPEIIEASLLASKGWGVEYPLYFNPNWDDINEPY